MLGGKPGTKGSGVPGRRVGYMPQVQFSCCIDLALIGWIVGVVLVRLLVWVRLDCWCGLG